MFALRSKKGINIGMSSPTPSRSHSSGTLLCLWDPLTPDFVNEEDYFLPLVRKQIWVSFSYNITLSHYSTLPGHLQASTQKGMHHHYLRN